MDVIETIGRSLADAFGMFWETLWALVLGFGLSGAVQAFVSRTEMQRALGDHRPRTIAKAGLFGAISSSCSYAATALAKTLFLRGADFTSAQAFMFASTNLVVELGIVLWLLVGWQFAAAEFVGGTIMIALLAVVLPRVVGPREQAAARDALAQQTGGPSGHEGHGEPDAPHASGSWRDRVRSLAGWSDAASYTISDLTMLRKELVIGFVVAGFADVAVPVSVWKQLFLTGHGFWSVLENVVLGPFLAIISFVCSVGNVPLAAALWTGGISFGGTVAFVFADLIALPLLIIYRRYYGSRLTLKLLGVFWATMSLAGLATEYLFKAVGLLPPPDTRMHGMVGRDALSLNYTTVLDVLSLLVFAAIYWLYRNRERFGGGQGYAKDPVCGLQVQVAQAPAQRQGEDGTVYFCSDHCAHRFDADPDRFRRQPAAASPAGGGQGHAGQPAAHEQGGHTDPVCGMAVEPDTAAASSEYAGEQFWFCSSGCRDNFASQPLEHLESAPDPVCGMTVTVAGAAHAATHDGVRYVFCSDGCRHRFEADPAAYRTSQPVR